MKSLRDYQNESVEFFLSPQDSGPRWKVLVLPTGGGKTVILKAAMQESLNRGDFKKILCVTPFRSIGKSFLQDEDIIFRSSSGALSAINWSDVVSVLPRKSSSVDLWSEESATKKLLAEMEKTDPSIIVASQQLFTRVYAEAKKFFCENCLLVIDETHHAGEQEIEGPNDSKGTILGDLTNRWENEGGTVWAVTATPFRSDAQRIFPMSAKILEFSYVDLAEKGFLPKNVTFRTIRVPNSGGKDQLDDASIDRICTAISSCRNESNLMRPTVIRIPQGRATQSTDVLAQKFVDGLAKVGIPKSRILNAVGTRDSVVEEFEESLELEREIAETGDFSGSHLDVIVSCRRMSEGADWPFCSHVVLIGLPQSILSVAQTVGRGSRNKSGFKNYPNEWKDEILVSCFVPESSEADDEEVKRALLMCSAIECNESLIDFRRFWDSVVRGFSLPPIQRESAVKSFVRSDYRIWGEAKVLTECAETALQDAGLPVTLENLDRFAQDWMGAPEIRQMARRQWIVEAVKAGKLSQEQVFGVAPAYNPSPSEGETYDYAAETLSALVKAFGHVVVPLSIAGMKATSGNLDLSMRKRAIAAFLVERERLFPLRVEDIARLFEKNPKFYEDLKFFGMGIDVPLTSEFMDSTGRFVRVYANDISRFLDRKYKINLRQFMLICKRDGNGKFPCPVTGPSLKSVKIKVSIPKYKKQLLQSAFKEVQSGNFGCIRVHVKDPRLEMNVQGRKENLLLLELSRFYGWRNVEEVLSS